ADRNRSHWSTSKTPSYTKSVSWHHYLSPSKVSSLNIDPNSQAQYQSPNFGALGALAGAGAAQGGLNRLVDYYTAIAEQQWPIVEISPGRAITFVVQTGTTIPTNLTSR
ncbi:hypothetical protein RZP92_25285, partial [Raoultella planticola]|nr:hypothetical protein [Raoultella planticola]